MNKLAKLNLIGVILFFTSCSTSMSPIEVNNILPPLTKSKFISQAQAQEMINTNKCKYLAKNRSYLAPIGLTKKKDLKNGAKGIDEWVQLDGGNAYILKNYRWNIIDTNGDSQLYIEFDTLICE